MRDGLQFGLSCNLANLAYCSIWPIWRLCQSGNLGSLPIWQQHTPRLKNIRETLQIHIKTQQGARLKSDETKTPDWQPKLANRIGKPNPVNLAIWNQSGRIAFDHPVCVTSEKTKKPESGACRRPEPSAAKSDYTKPARACGTHSN